MEIKVGEYVRTKDGIIAKVTDILKEYCIDCDNDVFDLYYGPMMEIPWEYIEEYIVKHSFNIKELIEPLDILGFKIKDFSFNNKGIVYKEYDARKGKYYNIVNGHCLEEVQIIKILTHEQYERDCYVVEEDKDE